MKESRLRLLGVTSSISWQVIFSFSFFAIIPILDQIGNEFSLSKAQIGLFSSSLYLGAAILSLPAGKVADKWGIGRALGGGLGLIGLCLVLFTFAKTFWLKIIITFVIGLGYSIVGPATNRLLMNYASFGSRGTMMGIKQMGVPGGSFFATLIIGGLAYLYNWSTALAAVGIIIVLLAFILFKLSKKLTAHISKSSSSQELTINQQTIFMVIYLSFIYLLFQSVQLSINTYLIAFAKEQLFWTGLSAGLLLALLQVSGAIGRVFWGALSDKAFHGNRANCLGTIALIESALLFYLSLFTNTISPGVVLFVIALLGITTLGWNGVAMIMVSESFGINQTGVITGAVLTIGFGGSVIFPPIVGWTVDWAGTYKFAWMISSLLMLVASAVLFISNFKRGRSLSRLKKSENYEKFDTKEKYSLDRKNFQ